jgi:transcriptional regulator with XRE-family HTH domain
MNNTPRKRSKTPVSRSKAPSKSAPSNGSASLEKPNVDDPLSESTRHRRVWAAYLARGFTRRQFAQELGTNYHTVNRWDAGAATISLDMLQRASELLHYTMDELCFGRRAAAAVPAASAAPASPAAPAAAAKRPTVASPSGVLTEDQIRSLLEIQRVDAQTRAAFGEHSVSPTGRYQSFTADYVTAWCAAFVATQSTASALVAAVNGRALSEAVAAGAVPLTADELRAAARSKT